MKRAHFGVAWPGANGRQERSGWEGLAANERSRLRGGWWLLYIEVLNWRGRLKEDERGTALPGSVGGEEVGSAEAPPF